MLDYIEKSPKALNTKYLTVPFSLEDRPKRPRTYPLTQSDLTLWDFPVIAGVPSAQGFLFHRLTQLMTSVFINVRQKNDIADDYVPSYCGPRRRRTTCALSADTVISVEP